MAAGPALVSTAGISFLGDLDIATGSIVSRVHPLRGERVAGFVLVLPDSVGSAGAWRFLYQLFVHGTHPLAIVQQALPDSSLVQGAILAGIPIVCDPAEDILTVIRTGDLVEVDGTSGLVRVTRAEGARLTRAVVSRPRVTRQGPYVVLRYRMASQYSRTREGRLDRRSKGCDPTRRPRHVGDPIVVSPTDDPVGRRPNRL